MMVGPPTDVVQEWRENWYCYWDGSFGMPRNSETHYVFRPGLEVALCGVVRPRSWEPSGPAREMFKELRSLLHLRGRIASTIGWGDEGDGRWIPLLVPWSGVDGALTTQSLLSKLGAHEEIIGACEDCGDSDDDCDDDTDSSKDMSQDLPKAWLRSHGEWLLFHAGSDKLNPLPCFAVAKVRPDLVAGFIGGICHT